MRVCRRLLPLSAPRSAAAPPRRRRQRARRRLVDDTSRAQRAAQRAARLRSNCSTGCRGHETLDFELATQAAALAAVPRFIEWIVDGFANLASPWALAAAPPPRWTLDALSSGGVCRRVLL